jgi:hypothetical protein
MISPETTSYFVCSHSDPGSTTWLSLGSALVVKYWSRLFDPFARYWNVMYVLTIELLVSIDPSAEVRG